MTALLSKGLLLCQEAGQDTVKHLSARVGGNWACGDNDGEGGGFAHIQLQTSGSHLHLQSMLGEKPFGTFPPEKVRRGELRSR